MKPNRGRAAKQVLITIDRKNLEDWNLFEAYIKKMKINKSALIRQLVSNFLKERPTDNTGPILAGSIMD